MKHYFLNCYTVFEIKAKFRELAMMHHPDKGGDNDTMRAILEQYHDALRGVHGQTSYGSDGKEHTYKYNWANEEGIAKKIQDILALRMQNVDVALVGTWIWVSGNTKPHATRLGRKKDKQGNPLGIGLTWHKKRCMWYWKPYKGRSRHDNKASFGDLANKYGYKKFQNDDENTLGG